MYFTSSFNAYVSSCGCWSHISISSWRTTKSREVCQTYKKVTVKVDLNEFVIFTFLKKEEEMQQVRN